MAAILACDDRDFVLNPLNSIYYKIQKTHYSLATLADILYTIPMNKQAILSRFLSQVHGKRLVYRGMRNGYAYYNLKNKGMISCNRYGVVTFHSRYMPTNVHKMDIRQNEFDFPLPKAHYTDAI